MSPTPITKDPRSDEQLVAAVNEGDAGAFEALYLRYRDWSVALAFRFTGDRDAALDVMQEAFLYLLRKFPGFALTAQMKTFLYPVIRHLAIAAAQKSRRFSSPTLGASDDELIDRLPAPPPATAPGANLGDLHAVLARLPAGQREVVVLRFVDDLSLQEIAAALGIPLGTVKSRLHLALATLRDDPRTKKYFEP